MYPCALCQNINMSIIELHNHCVQRHTLEELSYAIIDLQGFRSMGKKYYKSGDTNNNETLREHVVIEDERSNYRNRHYCSLHCDRFVAWEHELNKRIEIADDDFLGIVDNLCSDLSKRKRNGRKKKNIAITDKIMAENKLLLPIEKKNVKAETKTMGKFNHLPIQVSTTTSCGIPLIDDATANRKMFPTRYKTTPNTKYNNNTALTVTSVESDKNAFTYNLSNDNFSLRSIVSVTSDEK